MPARCVASSTSPVLGVVVPVDVLAGRSLHSDRVADLNERSTRRGTPGGQSGEAITGRKLRAIPGAPGCPARYEHAESTRQPKADAYLRQGAGRRTELLGIRAVCRWYRLRFYHRQAA